MMSQWQPIRGGFWVTLGRTGGIARGGGGCWAWAGGGGGGGRGGARLVSWVSFGGHWVEVWFLNWLRPRLSGARTVQVGARIGVWFVGGTGLALGMGLTAMALGFRPPHLGAWGPAWWLGGLAFIGIELVAQL